uniref:Uncharacterized protein n=1 Tax=Vitis vinifera TaxID=29760 RepID=A5B8D0_VITVI|nr:hypothetical protein VITISV_015658 [Vitis vinifera]
MDLLWMIIVTIVGEVPLVMMQSEIEESSVESISKSRIQGVWDPAHSTRVGIPSGCHHYIRLPPLHPADAATPGCRHFPPGCSHQEFHLAAAITLGCRHIPPGCSHPEF